MKYANAKKTIVFIFLFAGFLQAATATNIYFNNTRDTLIREPSRQGITGKPDTSFTNHGAWAGTRKKYPDIELVPEFHFRSVKEEKGLEYCNRGGRRLLLDAFLPREKGRRARAAIIIIHGGGWRSGNRTQHYPLAQKLASLGYVCFTAEYRLSTEALYPAAVYDIKSVIRWVRQNAGRYHLDTSKIAALGFSAGGELAAFMGTTGGLPSFEGGDCNGAANSNLDAVIDIDGTLSFVHPESREGNDSVRTSAATYWFGYAKKENPVLWEQASPLAYAGPHTPPTLFINSSVASMHAGREDYIRTLDKYHIYTEVHNFGEAPHVFCLFRPWFDPTVQYIDGFLQKLFGNAR